MSASLFAQGLCIPTRFACGPTAVDVEEHADCNLARGTEMRIGSIVFHTPAFDRTVAFWQAALGYVAREPAQVDWVVLRDPAGKGPNLSFQGRDHRPSSRSWIHLDLYTADQEAEVQRLEMLGARRYPWRYASSADFVVLEDPGGNLFCVVAKPDQ